MMRARVRLDKEDRLFLEPTAPKFGGREATVREALRRLATDHDRKEAFDAFPKAWDEEVSPLGEEEIAAVAKRCGL
ncbi:MAG: hypothetical protein OXB99_11430 [Acidimicrobiaceae bacterium]|nr:hypothetical protein [Acidimicrobiaceae bacterium]